MILKNNIVFRRENSASKKIVLEKSRVAACEFTTPINVFIHASMVYRV